jgi:hypothetical protein
MPRSHHRAKPDQPRRSCGGCTLCCTLLALNDAPFAKPSRCDCPFATAGEGCRIYRDRPTECRTMSCLWLQDGEGRFLADADRPDRSGVVVIGVKGSPPWLELHESVHGAADSEPFWTLVAAVSLGGQGVRIIGPSGAARFPASEPTLGRRPSP